MASANLKYCLDIFRAVLIVYTSKVYLKTWCLLVWVKKFLQFSHIQKFRLAWRGCYQRLLTFFLLFIIFLLLLKYYHVDTGRRLNVHETFRRRPGRLLNVLCTFNFRPVSTGIMIHSLTTSHWTTSHWIASMFVYLLHKHFALVTTR